MAAEIPTVPLDILESGISSGRRAYIRLVERSSCSQYSSTDPYIRAISHSLASPERPGEHYTRGRRYRSVPDSDRGCVAAPVVASRYQNVPTAVTKTASGSGAPGTTSVSRCDTQHVPQIRLPLAPSRTLTSWKRCVNLSLSQVAMCSGPRRACGQRSSEFASDGEPAHLRHQK